MLGAGTLTLNKMVVQEETPTFMPDLDQAKVLPRACQHGVPTLQAASNVLTAATHCPDASAQPQAGGRRAGARARGARGQVARAAARRARHARPRLRGPRGVRPLHAARLHGVRPRHEVHGRDGEGPRWRHVPGDQGRAAGHPQDVQVRARRRVPLPDTRCLCATPQHSSSDCVRIHQGWRQSTIAIAQRARLHPVSATKPSSSYF
jgi:hypothetical protein